MSLCSLSVCVVCMLTWLISSRRTSRCPASSCTLCKTSVPAVRVTCKLSSTFGVGASKSSFSSGPLHLVGKSYFIRCMLYADVPRCYVDVHASCSTPSSATRKASWSLTRTPAAQMQRSHFWRVLAVGHRIIASHPGPRLAPVVVAVRSRSSLRACPCVTSIKFG